MIITNKIDPRTNLFSKSTSQKLKTIERNRSAANNGENDRQWLINFHNESNNYLHLSGRRRRAVRACRSRASPPGASAPGGHIYLTTIIPSIVCIGYFVVLINFRLVGAILILLRKEMDCRVFGIVMNFCIVMVNFNSGFVI